MHDTRHRRKFVHLFKQISDIHFSRESLIWEQINCGDQLFIRRKPVMSFVLTIFQGHRQILSSFTLILTNTQMHTQIHSPPFPPLPHNTQTSLTLHSGRSSIYRDWLGTCWGTSMVSLCVWLCEQHRSNPGLNSNQCFALKETLFSVVLTCLLLLTCRSHALSHLRRLKCTCTHIHTMETCHNYSVRQGMLCVIFAISNPDTNSFQGMMFKLRSSFLSSDVK